MKITALNRFDVEEILHFAGTLAQCLDQLDQRLEDARQLGISGLQLPETLPALIALLDEALGLKDHQIAHVARLASASVHGAFKSFLEECRRLAEVEAELRLHLAGEISHSTVEVITAIESICAEHELDNLDVSAIAQKATSKRRAIAMALRLDSQIRPFAEQVPGSEHWRFGDVGKLKEVIATTDHYVIDMRNSALTDAAAPALLRELNMLGQKLSDERAVLSQQILMIKSVSIAELVECHNTFKRAGAWRFLSPGYRRARQLYSRFSKSKFQRSDAVAILEVLVDWKRREEEFSRDPRAIYLYGIHFNGIKTDFSFFGRVADFYSAVRVKFPEPQQKPIRDFLLLGEAELLLQVPVLDGHPETVTLRIIEESVPRFEIEALRLERACELLSARLRIFSRPDGVKSDFLPLLKRNVSDYIETRRRLDQHPEILAVFGPAFQGSKTVSGDYASLVSVCEALIALGPAGEKIAAVIAAGNASPAVKVAREIERLLQSSEAVSAMLNTKTGLDTNSVLNTGSRAERARALHLAANDREGLHAHSEFACAKEELDPALHGLADTYFAAKACYAGLGDTLEALALRSLARRAYEKYGGNSY